VCKNPKHSQKVLNAQFLGYHFTTLHHIIRAITMQIMTDETFCIKVASLFCHIPSRYIRASSSPSLTHYTVYHLNRHTGNAPTLGKVPSQLIIMFNITTFITFCLTFKFHFFKKYKGFSKFTKAKSLRRVFSNFISCLDQQVCPYKSLDTNIGKVD
jgi:hypothetical protein